MSNYFKGDFDEMTLGKINNLIKQKESELKIYVIEKARDENNNLHLLCKREVDGSYVVWTSYCSDKLNTSYENFYNGAYELSLKEAIEELCKRAKNGVDSFLSA